MSNRVVGEGTIVTLHFSIALPNGDIIDSTFDDAPATFTVGDGNLLAGFEEVVMGLASGAKQTFTVTPEKGFGQHNPSNIQVMPRKQFAEELQLEKGLMLSFADAQNTELPGVVTEFDEHEVTVDFNHPLAGKDILFTVEIIAVEPEQTH
jgi:FKBP-type peptidyl-prolyl cis-trans isomerase SlpA